MTRRVLRLVPLLLLLAVAAHQMWRVEADGLTRWRGGGFGMYSGIHYSENALWIGVQTPAGIQYQPFAIPASMEARVLAPRCTVFPTQESLEELLPHLSKKVRVVQVWRPRLDPETLVLERELLAEARR